MAKKKATNEEIRKQLVERISDLLPYCVVGDTVTITVLDMSPVKFEALPEFEGYYR